DLIGVSVFHLAWAGFTRFRSACYPCVTQEPAVTKPADSNPTRSTSLGRLPLTDRTVRALKPPITGRLDVWDEDYPGFGLRLSATRRRTWILMYRNGTTLRRFTLGQYPTLGLAEARA